MFYKFMGGDEESLLNVFDLAVTGGSIRFGSTLRMNDPFEFKFTPVAPSREEFDWWHATYEPERTPAELENAWSSFEGPAAVWNTAILPRIQLLESLYILCLCQRWESHLMWSHYASGHQGFVVRYSSRLIDVLRSEHDAEAWGNVGYRADIPPLKWFATSKEEMLGAIIFSKSHEWSYEEEYRVLMHGTAGKTATFAKVDPTLVSGVILGARAPESLIQRALAEQRRRPDFTVERVTSQEGSYALEAAPMDTQSRSLVSFL